MTYPRTKRVVALFDVVMNEPGDWDKSDIALHLETCTRTNTWHDATVWDSQEAFKQDLVDGYVQQGAIHKEQA
jgi:hypothetical protein